jgi:hypothetical protein
MKANPVKHTLFLTAMGFLFSVAACAPKFVVNGQVLDAETQRPIKGAAVAIRYFENQSQHNSSTAHTVDAAQELSDEDGNFNIPHHPDKNYVMGVYKDGYICWSSRSTFSGSHKETTITRVAPRVENGMQVRLQPLTEGHSRDQHASFTVLVAGEVAESQKGPFYKAIMPLFRKWRDNLRQEFQKKIKHNSSMEQH